jgi:hypothetical protein
MEDTKICFRCGKEKPLFDFYKHGQMADGHLNKCKDCTREDAKKRHYEKYKDEAFVVSERARSVERYHRLGYRDISRAQRKKKPYITSAYKALRKKLNQRGIIIDTNEEIHHWNYNYVYQVIIIKKSDHRRLHTKITLDKDSLVFIDNDSGNVIDSIEKHLELCKVNDIKYRVVFLSEIAAA